MQSSEYQNIKMCVYFISFSLLKPLKCKNAKMQECKNAKKGKDRKIDTNLILKAVILMQKKESAKNLIYDRRYNASWFLLSLTDQW